MFSETRCERVVPAESLSVSCKVARPAVLPALTATDHVVAESGVTASCRPTKLVPPTKLAVSDSGCKPPIADADSDSDDEPTVVCWGGIARSRRAAAQETMHAASKRGKRART